MSFLASEGGTLVSFLGSNDLNITKKASFLYILLSIHLACKAHCRSNCLTPVGLRSSYLKLHSKSNLDQVQRKSLNRNFT